SVELKRFAAAWGRSRFGDNPGRRPKRGDLVPEGDRVELAGGPSFAFDLGSGAALQSLATTTFAVEESTGTDSVTFTARAAAGLEIRETWRPRPESYRLDCEVAVAGGPAAAARDWSITLRSWPLLSEANPDQEMRVVRASGLVGKNLHRDAAQGLV